MEENTIEIKQVTEEEEVSSGTKIGIILGALVLLALLIGAVIFLLNSEKTPVIRDIFVILLGLELFVIGIATVLLILQTTRLINMFQHEIKPVLDKANETMSTLRGTAIFMSETLTEPVIKFSGYVASIRQALQMLKNLTK
jgi:membrane protein implicated in regulation of membrane protease activity